MMEPTKYIRFNCPHCEEVLSVYTPSLRFYANQYIEPWSDVCESCGDPYELVGSIVLEAYPCA